MVGVLMLTKCTIWIFCQRWLNRVDCGCHDLLLDVYVMALKNLV